MYLFVYKTTHINGKYYIGRHQTNDINDGYLGSGKWVSGIKDKLTLSREIIAETNSIKELYELEEYYIEKYWNDPLCMNMIKGSNGYTSEDNFRKIVKGTHPFQSREDGTSLQTDRVNAGTHHLLKREDGSSLTQDRVKEGTNPFQSREDGTSLQTDRVNARTHHLLKREDGSSVASDRVKEGTNPFQTREDGTSLQQDRVNSGTHNFLKREDGTSVSSDNNLKRVANGTHNFLTRADGTNLQTDKVANGTHLFLQNKGLVPCYNKQGEYKRIPKEKYHSQVGLKEDWEWVHNLSKEGKRRKPSF
nr:MAG: hypothetical protein [Caudoviricetes sp.]